MPTLNWIGKEAVVNYHQQVPFHLLKETTDLSCGEPGNGNLIVQGDILSVRRRMKLKRHDYAERLPGTRPRFIASFLPLMLDRWSA